MRTKKLTIYLKGGLGNQMFQYAYAKAKQIADVDIVVNTYQLAHQNKKYTPRILSIDNFNLSINTFENTPRKRDWWLWINNRFNTDLTARYSRYYADKKQGQADGYFNSEKYFNTVQMRELLLKEFTLKSESGNYKKWKEKIIRSNNSCIIHARRSDYLTQGPNPGLTILDEDYYKRALELLPDDITIFAFSDDPKWLQNALRGRSVTVVSGNNLADYEELSLMRFGKYFIIPNSTFAWWGAWLCKDKDKKVIAPAKWFNWKRWWRANRDVVPNEWTRI